MPSIISAQVHSLSHTQIIHGTNLQLHKLETWGGGPLSGCPARGQPWAPVTDAAPEFSFLKQIGASYPLLAAQ